MKTINSIILKGKIRNIQDSHTINGIEYQKADLVVPREGEDDDVISLRFKKFALNCKEDDVINIDGNIRSHSQKLADGKNKVDIYMFTYFEPAKTDENQKELVNDVVIDGRICKMDSLITTKDSKQNLHFILANNIIVESKNQKINNYIPCVAWGPLAIKLSEKKVGDPLYLHGQLHSRTYSKKLADGSTDIRVAHELVITEFRNGLYEDVCKEEGIDLDEDY